MKEDDLGCVEAVRLGLQAVEDGRVRSADEVIVEWEAL